MALHLGKVVQVLCLLHVKNSSKIPKMEAATRATRTAELLQLLAGRLRPSLCYINRAWWQRYAKGWRPKDELALIQYVRGAAIEAVAGTSVTLEQLAEELGSLHRYQPFMRRMRALLEVTEIPCGD
jgi:hypothetical protein